MPEKASRETESLAAGREQAASQSERLAFATALFLFAVWICFLVWLAFLAS
jgi:hypothetical protein